MPLSQQYPMFYIFAICVSLRLLARCVCDHMSVSWHFFAGRIYRRSDDGSICLHTSGILPGDRVGLVGPPCIITSVHDGYGVREVHREFQPTATTDTAVPLRSVPEHQDFIVQVFRDLNTQPYEDNYHSTLSSLSTHNYFFMSQLIYLIRPLIFNNLSFSLLIFICDIPLYYDNIIPGYS